MLRFSNPRFLIPLLFSVNEQRRTILFHLYYFIHENEIYIFLKLARRTSFDYKFISSLSFSYSPLPFARGRVEKWFEKFSRESRFSCANIQVDILITRETRCIFERLIGAQCPAVQTFPDI